MAKVEAGEGAGVVRGPQGDEAVVGNHVVDAVRHEHPTGQMAIVVVMDALRGGAVALSAPVQGSQQFLFLGVDAQYRRATLACAAAQFGDVAKLLVTLLGIDVAGDQLLTQVL